MSDLVVLLYRDDDKDEDDPAVGVEWDLGTVRGPRGVIQLAEKEPPHKRVQNGEPPNRDLHEVRSC